MLKTSPLAFIRQVRSEVAKVTWPTRKETVITTVMVVVMSVFASIFFLVADSVLGGMVGYILGIGA
ncbi:MAG: preprotein translocase subunit SecE [Hyphomicrobiales bacterium]